MGADVDAERTVTMKTQPTEVKSAVREQKTLRKYLIESFAEHRLVSCYDLTIILAQRRRKINELTEKNVNDNLLSTLEAILIIVV